MNDVAAEQVDVQQYGNRHQVKDELNAIIFQLVKAIVVTRNVGAEPGSAAWKIRMNKFDNWSGIETL